MESRYLGETGLKVSNICLGTMTFGKNPEDCKEDLAHNILDEFIAKGGNFIDTADIYSHGLSEEIIGRWLVKQPKRNKIILATKLRSQMDPTDPNSGGLSRHHIIHNIEQSLRRLQTDYIDLLYVHMWDAGTPIEETLRALTDLVRAGKVRYLGASNFTGWQVQLASDTSKRLGLEKFCCLQMQYSLLVRDIEWEITDVCKREGVGLLPWSPLKGGWLSGKMNRDVGSAPEGSRVANFSKEGKVPNQASPNWKGLASDDRTWAILDSCKKIAEKHGKTVAQVSNLCLGTMTFGKNPDDCNEETAHQIMDEFVAKGGNFIDTADIYTQGVSEEIIGRWLVKQPKRNKIILATKLMSPMDPTDPNSGGLSRHHIIHNIEQSLRRLQTDYIDLLYVHMWDAGTPIEETLRALTDLVRAGKVRYIGASNFTGWQVQLAADTSRRLGLERFTCLQMQYSLLVRDIEWEVTEVCKRNGVGLLPWSPLKGGWLSGKMVREEGKAPEGSRVFIHSQEGKVSNAARPSWNDLASDDRTWNVLDVCKEIAAKHNKTVAQVAIRWLLQKENVPSIVLGVNKLAQLQDNLGSLGWSIDKEEMGKLDEVSSVPLPYPYKMIQTYGKFRERKQYC